MVSIPLSENPVPTFAQIIENLLRLLDEPIALDELVDKILAVRSPQTKNPRRAVVDKIRELEGELLVRPVADQVLPLRLAFKGARFRLPLNHEIVDAGLIDLQAVLASYLPRQFSIEQLQLIDAAGRAIPFGLKKVSSQVPTLFRSYEHVSLNADLSVWFRSQKIYHKDRLLFTIEDWERGVFRLECEVASAVRQDLLHQRNKLLADIFYTLLEEARDEDIYIRIALPRAYTLLPDKTGYPADHWRIIIEDDPRMSSDGISIRYRDIDYSPLERSMAEFFGERLSSPSPTVSREQGQQVFRFKTYIDYDPKIWRTLEIQGRHTLTDLDASLREAFDHDLMDHLGGFWRLVPRRPSGRSRIRYREVDLGTVNPYELAEGSDTKIAALDLKPGDLLRYVYDFGDWIEHTLTLEAIQPPEQGVKYPREVARNQPRYQNCSRCLKEGKKSTAVWTCFTCSNKAQADIILCEACARTHDDEHYLDEILY